MSKTVAKYQKYAEYKDSGVEWLGAIPSDWTMNKLRYLFAFSKGLTITKENLVDEGIPCVNYGEVHSKYGFQVDPLKHNLKCVEESYLKSSANALLEKGDFIFADTSEDLKGSGNFTHLVNNEKVFAGYHTVIARPQDATVSRFYAYLFDSKEFRSQIQLAVKGVKVFSITQAMLRASNIWLPSKDEKNKIANFLDYETAKIDSLIEKQQQLIQLLNEKRQAVISHAVTKGLNPDVAMKDSGVEWLGEIPSHWGTVFLKMVIDVRDGTHETPAYVEPTINSYPLVTSKDVTGGWVDLSECKHISESDYRSIIKRSNVAKGDILMPMIGTVGSPVIVKDELEIAIKNLALFRTSDENLKIYNKFLYYFLNSEECNIQFILEGRGGVQNFVSLGTLRNLRLPYLSLNEQTEIADFLDYETTKIDHLINKVKQQIQLMQERRTALISAAVTGKIDVRNWQNPNKNNEAKTEFRA